MDVSFFLHMQSPKSVLIAVVGSGSDLCSAVLALEADGLVGDEMARARVGGSADSEANDDTCCISCQFLDETNQDLSVHEPRGNNSAGISRNRRRR